MSKKRVNTFPYRLVGIFFLVALFLGFIFSDFVLDSVIENTILWYYVSNFRLYFIVIILTIVVMMMLRPLYRKYQQMNLKLSDSEKNYRLVVDNLQDDYFFYRHEPGRPFIYLSSSVTSVTGYSKEEFSNGFREAGALILYEGAFVRHQKLSVDDIKQPPFEISLRAKSGRTLFLDIKEIVVKNEQGEMIAIEGIAKNITRYKQVENELLERENKYHMLFEAARDGFFIMKGDKFIDCNKRITEMFDCSLEDVIMHTPYSYKFSPVSQPDDRNSREKALEKIRLTLQGQSQMFEWRHLKSNGDPFDVEVTLNRFYFNNEFLVLAIVRDISSNKETETMLNEKEHRFKLIFDNNPVGIMHFDENGIVNDCNEALLNILNTNREALIGFELKNELCDDSLKYALNECLLGKNSTFEGEYHSILGDIDIYLKAIFTPVLGVDGMFKSGFGMILETTEQYRAMQKSIRNEALFREILENARNIHYKLEVESGNYEYISPSINEILGYRPDEFYAMDAEQIKQLLHPDDLGRADSIVAKLVKAVSKEKAEFMVEYRIRHKNGDYCWVSDRYRVVFEGDQASYVIGNVLDISKLKEAEESIRHFMEKASVQF